ncbi:MAG TPA: PRD domain-containing protein [Candidatus Flavonifractor merdigallinarum]|uniref:PRD domain-containing protein n=1 Tax=Candidatus Flavonifractor merdigallinarum TaxID=2838589 RepID=A0A9D2BZG5_9FIRM|nr:PRD domain-containing protein [Candidatus Flavonifractor merdigallinarum]
MLSYQVLKTINNNIVSCVDTQGKELIIMGRGLGFGVKAGARLSEDKVEKVFRMEDPTEVSRLEHLFASLPADQIRLCASIIDYAKETLRKELSEGIYYTLTDHICFTLQRIRKGIHFSNALQTEVRIFYPQEYAVGLHALDLIEQQLKVRLPEDEAATIALHIVNAEYSTSISVTMHTVQAMHDLVNLLDQWEGLNVDHQSLYFDELIVHLKFVALSAFSGRPELRPEKEFIELVRKLFPVEFACAAAMMEYLSEQSHSPIPEENTAYLCVYIHRANTLSVKV